MYVKQESFPVVERRDRNEFQFIPMENKEVEGGVPFLCPCLATFIGPLIGFLLLPPILFIGVGIQKTNTVIRFRQYG
jgi:hypothetical protein